MPEECPICGVEIDGVQHSCSFREPTCLADDMKDMNTVAKIMLEHLQETLKGLRSE